MLCAGAVACHTQAVRPMLLGEDRALAEALDALGVPFKIVRIWKVRGTCGAFPKSAARPMTDKPRAAAVFDARPLCRLFDASSSLPLGPTPCCLPDVETLGPLLQLAKWPCVQ